MDSPVMAIGLVVAGAIVGYASSFALARTQHRQALTLRVADEYFAVRRELVTVVSELADIDLREELASGERGAKASAIAALFYRNFDLLPRPVLDRIILLHVAVRSPLTGPYRIETSAVVPMSRAELEPFIERCSIFTNSRFTAPLALSSDDETVRGNQVIKLHARDVLYTLSEHSSIDSLAALARHIRGRYA